MESPAQIHLQNAKRILRCIKGTLDYGMFYTSSDDPSLVGYPDSDWASDVDDRRSTLGNAFFLGNTLFTWSSRKLDVVALFIVEAEYISASSYATQAIWFIRLFGEFGHLPVDFTQVFCDNSSIAKIPIFYGRCKHNDVYYHFIQGFSQSQRD